MAKTPPGLILYCSLLLLGFGPVGCLIDFSEAITGKIKNLNVKLKVNILNIEIHKKAGIEAYQSEDLDDVVLLINSKRKHSDFEQTLEATKVNGVYDFQKAYTDHYEFEHDSYGYFVTQKSRATVLKTFENS